MLVVIMQAKLVSCWSNIRQVTRDTLTAKHLQLKTFPCIHHYLFCSYKCSRGLYPQLLIFEISVDCCYHVTTSSLLRVVILIGVGTRGARVLPIIYPRDFINIHTCSADRRVAVYITFSPPKMELLPTPVIV